MMDLPKLKKTIDGRKRQRATTFDQALGGYNHNLRTKAGEFYDMKNISLDNYPVIGTRQGISARYLEFQDFLEEGDPHGLHEYAENTLMAVFGKTLHVGITAASDGSIVSDSTTLLSNSEKTFATIGTKTMIMPDKVIYDTSLAPEKRLYKIEQSHSWDSFDSANYYLLLRTIPCDIDGKMSSSIVESGSDDDEYVPSNPTEGMWWYRGFTRTWYEYKNSDWTTLEKPYTRLIPVLSSDATTYVKETNPSETALNKLEEINDFFKSLKVLDSFNLKKEYMDDGDEFEDVEQIDYVVYGKTESSHDPVWQVNLNSLIIAEQATRNIVMYVARIKCPDNLNHIFGLNNRIWGVTPNYEEDEEEPEIHHPKSPEIFACKLGDPTQWYNYADTASDSFALTLGNDKEVTAGCAYNNTPHFFTEDTMIKIYGDYPSNYQTRTFDTDGVVSGGHDTLVQVEGLLFWVSPIGVVAYEGSLPYLRSQDFEPNSLLNKKCAAGKDGTKYCLSVSHGTTNDGIYAYDTQTGMWARFLEDEMIKASELKNALCYVNDQKQLVMLYDRTKENDTVAEEAENLMRGWLEKTPASSFVIDYSKYYTSIALGSNGATWFDEAENMTSIGFYQEGKIDLSAVSAYWSDSDNPLKNCNIGVGYPLPVEAGKKYAFYYTKDSTHGGSGYARVGASVRNHDGEAIAGYTSISPGEVLTMPEGAETIIIVLGQYHVAWTDYVTYEGPVFREVHASEEEPIEWSLETGNLGLDTPDQKYISRVQMRIDFIGSLNVDISYDDSEYLPVHVSQSDHMKSITVPIKVRRCDHFKLKLSGTGQMRLYSFGYETDEGSARCLI